MSVDRKKVGLGLTIVGSGVLALFAGCGNNEDTSKGANSEGVEFNLERELEQNALAISEHIDYIFPFNLRDELIYAGTDKPLTYVDILGDPDWAHLRKGMSAPIVYLEMPYGYKEEIENLNEFVGVRFSSEPNKADPLLYLIQKSDGRIFEVGNIENPEAEPPANPIYTATPVDFLTALDISRLAKQAVTQAQERELVSH